jgi:GWxTD domain-containing protein
MKRPAVLLALLLVSAPALVLLAASPAELFQKAKAQYAGGSYTQALATLEELEKESQKPGNEAMKNQLAPALSFYRAASLAELGKPAEAQAQFAIFLEAQPNAVIDQSIFPKKTFAAFEEARKKAGPRPEPVQNDTITTAYAAFRAPQPAAGAEGEAWADGPSKFLMTSDEKREWASLRSASERSEFVTKFWAARNPKPEAADNPFRREFEKRVAFADSRYGQDETKGSLTDRGMVFVLMGPPTYVGRKPLTTAEDTSSAAGMSTVSSNDVATAQNAMAAASPKGKTSTGAQAALSDRMTSPNSTALGSEANWREVWHYRKELLPPGVSFLQVDVEFITKKGYGKNVLQRGEPMVLSTLEAAKKTPRG